MTLHLRPPSAAALLVVLERARASSPTYDHVGSTVDPTRWGRRGERVHRRVVGHGDAAFASAREALVTWVPQRSIGIEVVPSEQPVEADATVVLVIRRGPFHVVIRNRVVGFADEPRRFVYAYGSLPGHDERGEESFLVEHLPDGSVLVTIRVHAVAGSVLARAAAPIVRLLSTAALLAYLRAVQRHVAQPVGGQQRP